MKAADDLVEHLSRHAAGRSTRRSFIGRVGKVAVLVAGGPAIVTLLADEAEARVCGQTGVSPKCPTFDCDEVWGWCWYATGCCADGLLKKICDCCAPNWPNVHGYCPGGTNVKCIVESCGTDPRVQTVPVSRIATDDHFAAAAAIRSARFPMGSPLVVVGDSSSPQWAAVALAAAELAGAPLLIHGRHDATPELIDDLRRLGASQVRVVGSQLPPVLDATLVAHGFAVERIGADPDLSRFSHEVALWAVAAAGSTRAVAVSSGGVSAEATPVAVAAAARLHAPLVVDPVAGAGLPTLILVGPEAAGHGPAFPGAVAIGRPDIVGLASELARLVATLDFGGASFIVVAPRTTPALLALATLGEPIILTEPNTLAGGREWIREQAARLKLGRVYLGGSHVTMNDSGYYELQSIVNGYAADKLIGSAGQGLPVWEQPLPERELGRARLGTDPPPPGGRSAPPTTRRRRVVVRRRRRRR